jgi:hypothetical protein
MDDSTVVEELPLKRGNWFVDVNTEQIYVFNCRLESFIRGREPFYLSNSSPLVYYETSNYLS